MVGPILAALSSLSRLLPPPAGRFPPFPSALLRVEVQTHLVQTHLTTLALGRGGQAAGVQARSGPSLEMTLGSGLPPGLRHLHQQGRLHTAPSQQSRQKENVNPSPRIPSFPTLPEAIYSSAPL